MIEEKDMTAVAPVALRDEDGAVRDDYVERVAQAIADGDSAALRELIGDPVSYTHLTLPTNREV